MINHLIKDTAPIELYTWLSPAEALPGWDVFSGNPFNATQPEDEFTSVQNYFAEYHLEYYRQRQFNDFPSRLHSLLLFATRIDAENFRAKQPGRVAGKHLVCARSQGAYLVSFHDSGWLDYLRLPHNLSLSVLDEVSSHYWNGTLVEEAGMRFQGEPWWEPPVIEALFQGKLEPIALHEQA